MANEWDVVDTKPMTQSDWDVVSSAPVGKATPKRMSVDEYMKQAQADKQEKKRKEDAYYESPDRSVAAQGKRLLDSFTKMWDEGGAVSSPLVTGGDAALHMGTGLLSSVGGGLIGAGQLAKEGVMNQVNKGLHIPTEEEFINAYGKAGDTIRKAQEDYTYQPRTGAGKFATELAAAPLTLAKAGTRAIGGGIGQALGGAQGRVAGEAMGDILPDVAASVEGLRGGITAGKTPVERVPVAGKDYTPMRNFSPEEQARYNRMKAQGIDPTLSQVTRDPAQYRFENQTGAATQTGAGNLLHEREMDINSQITDAIKKVDERFKDQPSAANIDQTGESVKGAFATEAKRRMAEIDGAYNAARRAGETKEAVDISGLEKYLTDNRAKAIAVPELKAINAKLAELKKLSPQEKPSGLLGPDGKPIGKPVKPKVTIDDLESLRQAANELRGNPGTPANHFMKEINKEIDKATEGKGGEMYKQARSLRKAYGDEFERNGAVARLLEKKGKTNDPRVAIEDVYRDVMVRGSQKELGDVLTSLRKIDPKVDKAGVTAIRDLQAQTIRSIVEKATEKGAPNKRGIANLSAPRLRDAINEIGRPKLEMLLGKDAASDLYNLSKTASETKLPPGSGRVTGSDSAVNFRDQALQKVFDKSRDFMLNYVPGGKALHGLYQDQMAKLEAAQKVKEALNPQMASREQIKTAAEKEKAINVKNIKERRAKFAKKTAPAAIPTQDNKQDQE